MTVFAQTASATELCPDGELIELCGECDALYQRFQATFRDEFTLAPDVALQEKRKVITTLQRDVLDRICAMHATTLDGLRARNRVNVLDSLLGLYWPERMKEALHRDLAGRVAVVKHRGAQPAPCISIPALPGESQPALQGDENSQVAPHDVSSPQRAERRRPGRLEISNWQLLLLLREPGAVDDVDRVDKAGGAFGLRKIIVAGLVLSVPLWTLLAYLLVYTLGPPAWLP